MIKLTETVDLSENTLIIPSVAVGNVAQLAVDLLITSINMKRVGRIVSSCFIPILGADPYAHDSTELCTACDIYHNMERKLIAFQIRSPTVRGLKDFFNDLKQFIKVHKISKVIVLTSGWAHTRTDEQLRTEPLRYLISPSIDNEFGKKFVEFKCIKLESTKNPFDDTECFQIPGGGYSMKLYHYLINNQIPVAIILKFCSEGDNIPDAVELAVYLDKLLPCGVTDFDGTLDIKYPHSWKFLFGNPAPLEIY